MAIAMERRKQVSEPAKKSWRFGDRLNLRKREKSQIGHWHFVLVCWEKNEGIVSSIRAWRSFLEGGRVTRGVDAFWNQEEALGSFLHVPYNFTHENGETQRKIPRVTQLLVAEPRPPGPLAWVSIICSTVSLARGSCQKSRWKFY